MSIQAILFDLDGTFLEFDMVQELFPHYLRALTEWMSPYVPPERFVSALHAGTEAITHNDGQQTNAEAFAAAFFARVEQPRELLEPAFEAFYREAFPALQHLAHPRPAARRIVERAFALGYEVVIATNPYFPASATLERLRWANIADFPYRHITTYENSRAVKPTPRYYYDILELLGREPAEALMVGDEVMDMAAGALGCLTYMVESPATAAEAFNPPPTFQGDLEALEKVLVQLRAQ